MRTTGEAECAGQTATTSTVSTYEASHLAQPSATAGSSSDCSIYHSGSDETSIELQTPNSSFPSGYQVSPYDVEYDAKGFDLGVFDGVSPSQPPLMIETVLEYADTKRTELPRSSVDSRILDALDALDCVDGSRERFLATITEEDLAALSAYPSARSFASTTGGSSNHLALSFPVPLPVTGQLSGPDVSFSNSLLPSASSGRQEPLPKGSGKYLDSLCPRLYPRSLSTSKAFLWAPIFLPAINIYTTHSVKLWAGPHSEEIADVD